MSDERLTIWRCPGCGERHAFAGSAHMHDGKRVPAEEVEVVPVEVLRGVEEKLAKAEKHCEEAIDDVVRAEKLVEHRIEIEREDGTPFGRKFCEEILAELRATDSAALGEMDR